MRCLTLGALLLAAPAAAEVPSPESVLGFRPGSDRRLADWHEIADYFHRLDAASDRVRVEEVGKTTAGLPFLLVTITSEANMARLEAIRQANARLADPRGLGEEDARRIVAEGKAIVALNHGIHSTEVAAPHTAMETAYTLASSDAPWVREVLDQSVVLMLPSHNPDGTQRVTEWYRSSLGHAWEGGELPFLYHPYVGHDNNRDWYMFTQQESRLTATHLYDRWHPQVVHDLHQMGTKGARLFVPPYLDPWEPNVDPALRAAANAVGMQMAAVATAEGKPGVVVNAIFDAWTPARAYPFFHGGVRVLSEVASARQASPLDLAFEALEAGTGYDPRQASWNFPRPWTGGSWRLRDIMDYQATATRALLQHAARNRAFWLATALGVNRRACARTEPYAVVLPAEQPDPWAATRLLQVLRTGAVEVHRARAPFQTAGSGFAAGSHVVLMQQPASAFAKALLESQRYPDLRKHPDGPPLRPYDVTAHTLPLLLGVTAITASEPFAADLERLDSATVAPGQVSGRGRFLAFGHKTGDLVALGRLLGEGIRVRWALEAFVDAGRRFAPGTLLAAAGKRERLVGLARELGLELRAVSRAPRALALRAPRVGLYQSWVASMDEGWTRYVFEKEMGVAYRTLHDADVQAGLEGRFDVVILADQERKELVNGHAPGSLPDAHTGGLGPTGVARLKGFVEAGGTLVALNRATELPLQDFGLGATNALAGVKDDAFFCPGAILRATVDPTHPLAHGLGESSIVWFEDGPAFDLAAGRAVLSYAEDEPLLSGWLRGGTRLKGKAALAELPLGKGKVVLFGFRPQYRAQSWATYVALLNALYLSAATPAR